MAIQWRDNGFKYGAVTRLLHWSMVTLLAWQFAGMGVKLIVGKAPITAFWVGTHKSVGAMLLLLLVIRALWGLYNMRMRPAHGGGFWGLAAKVGHQVLYALMFVVPASALLRQYGSGKPMEFFGLPFIQGGGAEVAWMTAPANAFHGLSAWVLLAAIVGHVLMVLVHRYVWKDDVAQRMVG
jgi:cytochrome b561